MSAQVIGGAHATLTPAEVTGFVASVLGGSSLAGKSVCLLVPDSTRTAPMPLILQAVHRSLGGRVRRLSTLVALGTHQPMPEEELGRYLGFPPGRVAERYPGMVVKQHEWWDPATFVELGELSASRVTELSEGLLNQPVIVRINRAVVEHDVTIVLGPVFPHEVVGYSGGNKYFFPGVSGPEIIDVSHWLGALVTSGAVLGQKHTPVRSMIDAAAQLIPTERLCLAFVVESGSHELRFVAFGSPEDAWSAAADIAAHSHIRYLDEPVPRVLSLVSQRYDEIWTAAKGMYKVDPIVRDGGEVVLFAPHIREVSRTHGEQIAAIGYHCRDYFVAQWERFRHVRGGVLAHSTHLRGTGTYSEESGEHCRITVTLATGIDEGSTRALGLNYRDPATVDPEVWAQDAGTVVVPDAGEVLYRLRSASPVSYRPR